MPTMTWKRGDTGPVTATLLDRAGTAVNLTGATVKFLLRNAAGGPLTIDREIDVDTPASGVVSIDRTTTDTATAGHFRGEFEVTYSGGDVETFPEVGYLDVMIHGDLG